MGRHEHLLILWVRCKHETLIAYLWQRNVMFFGDETTHVRLESSMSNEHYVLKQDRWFMVATPQPFG